jgi:hypothetical protein
MDKKSSFKQQDRRSGNDRRQFTFTLHIPERRNGNDRRESEGNEKKSKTSTPKDVANNNDS